jgi:hypothetical protein
MVDFYTYLGWGPILASLTSTCRRHDIDPQLYLTQLLVNLPSAPISELSAWLPDQRKLRQSTRTLTPYRNTTHQRCSHSRFPVIRCVCRAVRNLWIDAICCT